MAEGLTEIYCGTGRGKTTMAIGQGLKASVQGNSVIIIQFLKGRERKELDFLEELDGHDIKIFRFEKQESRYQELNEQEKEEERRNILNGVNFARKVVSTYECDFLVLDEILGLLNVGIITTDVIIDILKMKNEKMHIIMTGDFCPEELKPYVDSITNLTTTQYTEAGR